MFTVNISQLKAHFPHQKHDLVVNSVILTHPKLAAMARLSVEQGYDSQTKTETFEELYLNYWCHS